MTRVRHHEQKVMIRVSLARTERNLNLVKEGKRQDQGRTVQRTVDKIGLIFAGVDFVTHDQPSKLFYVLFS